MVSFCILLCETGTACCCVRFCVYGRLKIPMRWDVLFFFNSMMLGVGLAMDAFSVSLANGLNQPEMSKRRMLGTAGVFALFQAVMPIIGWVCVHTVAEYFGFFQKLVPWISLALLLYIGIKMIISGVKNKDEAQQETRKNTLGTLLVQGVATSIDALSVGFTISDYDWLHAFVCVAVIAAVTLIICLLGVYLGKKFGTRLSNRAEILGGAILVVIGIEIFVKGIL